jgi:hypothetical protein
MKRYREDLDEVEVAAAGGPPAGFRWRGRQYDVVQVLGHWHEDAGWWHRSGGVTVRVERTDLWRVEACGASMRTSAGASDPGGSAARGIYELVRRRDRWRLDRVWD